MKKILVLVLVVAGGWFAYSKWGKEAVKAPVTTNSHRGAATLFMDATLAKNLDLMKKYCTGMAIGGCENVLSNITATNPTFARYAIEMGGDTGGRISGMAHCYGEKGDMFMTVALTMEKQNGVWSVCEVSCR